MKRLAFVYAYYDNPSMLALQYALWASYPEVVKSRLQMIVVDDASPNGAALDVPRPEGLPELRIYRVRDDIPWHQDGARNLGAFVAPEGWLFLSDMDHALPQRSLLALLALSDDDQHVFYTFARHDHETGKAMLNGEGLPKPHPNSYAMHRSLYWRAGGYDEDYCGLYGTDGRFRKQLLRVGRHRHLEDVSIVRYSRACVADASTRTLARKSSREEKLAVKARKEREGRSSQLKTLAFEWKQVL